MSESDQAASPNQNQTRLRWARSQKFRLTPKGGEAELLWRTRLSEVRSQGKQIFEAALQEWATQFKVRPDDAAYLSELAAQPVRLEDIAKAVADTGASREQVKTVLERLYEAGLMESAAPAP